MMNNDLSLSALKDQAVCQPGGACRCDAPAGASVDDRTFVRLNFVFPAEREFPAESVQHVMDGYEANNDFAISIVGDRAVSVVVAVPGGADVVRVMSSWSIQSGAQAVHRKACQDVSSWVSPTTDAGAAIRDIIMFGGVISEGQRMETGWEPRKHRVYLRDMGACVRFMIEEMTLSDLLVTRADGAAGCLRRCSGGVLEMFDRRACASVRLAIFETDMMRTGCDTNVKQRCDELRQQCPEACALRATSSKAATSWADSTNTKTHLHKKLLSMGGTTYTFDETVINPLLSSGTVVLKEDDTHLKYKQYQFTHPTNGFYIVAIPGGGSASPHKLLACGKSFTKN